jgi:hypothetical protein
VLDWNKASIDYYARKGAVNLTAQEGWVVFRYGIQADISSTEKEDKIDALKSVCSSCSSRQYYFLYFCCWRESIYIRCSGSGSRKWKSWQQRIRPGQPFYELSIEEMMPNVLSFVLFFPPVQVFTFCR